MPYPTVPSPTLYDVPFSHNTKRYRQTTDRQTTGGQNIVPEARPYYPVWSAKKMNLKTVNNEYYSLPY